MATSTKFPVCTALKTAVTVYGKNWTKISVLLGYNAAYCKEMWMNTIEPEVMSQHKRSQTFEKIKEDSFLKINKRTRRLSEESAQEDAMNVPKRRRSFSGSDVSFVRHSEKPARLTRMVLRNILEGVDGGCDKFQMLKKACVKLVTTIRACEARNDISNKFEYVQRCEKKLKALLWKVLMLSKNLVLVRDRSGIPPRSLVTVKEYLTEEELKEVVELNYKKLMKFYGK